jgi:hypothetical protein
VARRVLAAVAEGRLPALAGADGVALDAFTSLYAVQAMGQEMAHRRQAA